MGQNAVHILFCTLLIDSYYGISVKRINEASTTFSCG